MFSARGQRPLFLLPPPKPGTPAWALMEAPGTCAGGAHPPCGGRCPPGHLGPSAPPKVLPGQTGPTQAARMTPRRAVGGQSGLQRGARVRGAGGRGQGRTEQAPAGGRRGPAGPRLARGPRPGAQCHAAPLGAPLSGLGAPCPPRLSPAARRARCARYARSARRAPSTPRLPLPEERRAAPQSTVGRSRGALARSRDREITGRKWAAEPALARARVRRGSGRGVRVVKGRAARCFPAPPRGALSRDPRPSPLREPRDPRPGPRAAPACPG